jgi:hypothetical protein
LNNLERNHRVCRIPAIEKVMTNAAAIIIFDTKPTVV